MKTGRLSKKEKEFIDQNPEMELVEIAEALDRSREVIVTYKRSKPRKRKTVKSKEKNTENNITPITTSTVKEESKPSMAGELIARNKRLGVVVMTESASQHSDQNRKKPNPPSRYRGMIHKIKED